MKTPLNTIKFK